MKLKIIFGLLVISLLVSHDASAFLPLTPGTIIVQQTTTTGKQGTYNQTLANNVIKNLGGQGINLINGSGNPITMVNDPTRNQINITIAASAAGGVTSLNALAGALTIACVAGNTTCTTSGGNTITINTAYNIVTTGLSAQTINKQLTLNSLVLGGNANGGNKNFTSLNNVNATKFYQNGKQVLDTLVQAGSTTITGSGNSRTISSATFQNNTGTNLGTSGTGVYSSMSGSILQFLKLISANSNCSFGSNSTNVILTCTNSGGTVITSKNGGHATGSVGVLAQPTSTIITARNITGTNPISVTKTNDTDIAVSCSTCTVSGVTSVSGTAGNTTSSGGATPIINLGSNAVVTNGNAQNFTAGKKVGFIPTSATAGILIGTTSSNPTSLRQGDIFLSGAFMGYNDNTNTTRQLVNLNSAQSLSSKTLADTSTFVASVADSSKKVGFLNSGASTSTTLLLQDNQTSSQHLNWPAIRETETLAVKPQINFTAQANRTGTSNLVGLMLGPGTAITPQVTGRIKIDVTAYATQSGAGDGCTIQIRYGTGGDPANAAALTGTAVGSNDKVVLSATTGREHMGVTAQVTGLTVGTRVWVELSMAAITAGTCTINNVNWSVNEL